MNYRILNLEQGSDEWLGWRKTKVTASDAPIIMEESPYRTKYELWQEKCGLREARRQTDAMKRGVILEPIARKWFNNSRQLNLKPVVVESLINPWMGASLDGLDGLVAYEAKCPGERDHTEAKQGKVPPHYVGQLQHTMYTLGLDKMFYHSWVNEFDCVYFLVDRDDSYIEKLLIEEKKFYDCVMQRIPPDCRETRTIQMETEEWQDLMHGYDLARSKRDWWEMEMESIKKKAVELSGGCEAQGQGFKLSRVTRKGQVDNIGIYQSFGITDADIEGFRKPDTEYWTITKDKKNG